MIEVWCSGPYVRTNWPARKEGVQDATKQAGKPRYSALENNQVPKKGRVIGVNSHEMCRDNNEERMS